jgi:hypothetical protein
MSQSSRVLYQYLTPQALDAAILAVEGTIRTSARFEGTRVEMRDVIEFLLRPTREIVRQLEAVGGLQDSPMKARQKRKAAGRQRHNHEDDPC